MRMWMVDPQILCQKHLCGEHLEMHMFCGAIQKGKNVAGYLSNNLLEPKSLILRHAELAKEMLQRGYNHRSPLEDVDLSCLTIDQQSKKINRESSLMDLLGRCSNCFDRHRIML